MPDNDVKPQSSIDKYVMPYIESLPSLDGENIGTDECVEELTSIGGS